MRKFYLQSIVLFAGLIFPILGTAQDSTAVRNLGNVVVTGNRFETPIEKSGRVIYKITAADIQQSAGRTVADLLNQLPGINVDGAFGTPGTNLDYHVRGGRNRHTLILIDGLPISDPSSISNDYDLRLLDANLVESIEVLKGGASALYGTGAAAGVINIKLKEARSEKPQVTLSQEVGSFNTSNTNVDIQGKAGRFRYLVAGALGLSDGISAAQDNDPNVDFGDDGLTRYSARTNLSYEFSDAFQLSGNFSFDRVNADYDDAAFTDGDNEFIIRQLSIGLRPKLTYQKGSLELKFNYNKTERDFLSAFPFSTGGDNYQFDLTNQYIINDQLKAIVGVQYQNFEFNNGVEDVNNSNTDPYLNIAYDIVDGLTLNAGARLNNNSEYGGNLVYNVNPSYLFDLGNENQLKLFGSYSTAFITPSLFQLLDGSFGNTNLEPEETESWEFGAALYLGETLTFNAEYFNRKETNAIGFFGGFDNNGNFVGSYENVDGKRKINGLEFDLTWQITSPLTLTAHYANYNFGDPTQFYRIPDQKLGARIDYALDQNTRFSLNYSNFGERLVGTFTAPFEVALEGYNLVDFNVTHQLFDGSLVLRGAVNNLLDEDFVGVYGFSTRPANFTLGATLKF